MKRRLFNLAVLVSLLLCLACIFMWARSGYVDDSIGKYHGGGLQTILSSREGRLTLVLLNSASPSYYESQSSPWYRRPPAGGIFARIPGQRLSWTLPHFRVSAFTVRAGAMETIYELHLPYWLLTLTTAFPPALWFWQRRSQKKAARRRGFAVEVQK